MTHTEFLARYTAPNVFTGLDGFESQIDALPGDVASLAGAIQGLLIHEGLASDYGISVPAERAAEKQLHGAAAMLARASRLDDRPLGSPRPPERRVVCVCRHFAVLFVACMRRKGVPARARCGFADYFEPGKHLDHWVGEYWSADEDRWILVDAQVDSLQRRKFQVGFDTLDVPRDRFLVAGEGWHACRSGADPMNFGVAGTTNWGLVEVYGDLFQDLAALQNIELLPWGWYGLATDERGMEEAPLIDALASISAEADAPALDRLRQILASDDRLRVPNATVAAILAAEQGQGAA